MLVVRLLVSMPRLLTTVKLLLLHQSPGAVATEGMAALGRDGGNRPRTGRAVAFGMDGFHHGAVTQSLRRYLARMRGPVAVTAALNTKDPAKLCGWISPAPLKPTNQRKLFISSDIKSAVAFFRMSFSISRLRIRF